MQINTEQIIDAILKTTSRTLVKWMYSVKDSAFYLKRKYNMCNFS